MHKILITLLWFLFPLTIVAQGQLILNDDSRAAVVNQVCRLLDDNYVFPETAHSISGYLNQQLKAGAYKSINDPVDFSDKINGDIQSICEDGHLMLQYNPSLSASLSDTVRHETASQGDPFRELRQTNFGLNKLEILKGNIGYLNIERFRADPVHGRETLKAALKFLSNANAIIIDLRTSGGGSPETVAMICGFFFDKPVHVNDSYSRPDNSTTEFWTNPDSTFRELNTMPLYILTSRHTFSASEEFAYDLQSLGRATLIGEITGGGAHNTFEQPAGYGFVLFIPYGRAVNPVTHTNWEKTGVMPDILVAADKSLETAEMKIFEGLITEAKDPVELFNLNWQFDLLKAANNPEVIDSLTMKKFAGVYGERVFTFENGKLFYQRTGKPKFELEPMTSTVMKGKGNDYFRIEFIEKPRGQFNQVKASYQDSRVETSFRTK